MKFPKVLIPFLAVVLPTIRFSANDTEYKVSQKNTQNNGKEIASDESRQHAFILRQFSDSERFLQFAKHSSHSSHSAHSSHKSHSSHTSGSGGGSCNGCAFDDDEEFEEQKSVVSIMVAKN